LFSLLLLFIIQDTILSLNVKPDIKVNLTPKNVFLKELGESVSNNPILENKNPENLNILLADVIKANPNVNPGSTRSVVNFSKGKWSVVYAPHIKTLGKVLFTDFSVFYEFLDIGEDDKQGIISNVMYDSKIFGRGWLNTKGIIIMKTISITLNMVIILLVTLQSSVYLFFVFITYSLLDGFMCFT
jgi:hypothetical protein